MQIESLQQYITIDSRKIHLRVATKTEDGTWKFSELSKRDDTVFIDTIELGISLENIYEGIQL